MKMTDEERYTCLINIGDTLEEQMLSEMDNDKCREIYKQRVTINYLKDELAFKLLEQGIIPKDIDIEHLMKKTLNKLAELLGLDISGYYKQSIENYNLGAVNYIQAHLNK